MSARADLILEQIHTVERLRQERAHDPALSRRVLAIKCFQARRFELSYADMRRDPRYAQAVEFFLEELYGPREFTARDAQFARVVPTITRIFPEAVIHTVETLSNLHALSERLDTEMASHLAPGPMEAQNYLDAWRMTGRLDSRTRQIELTLEIGRALEKHTRSRLIGSTLRMMRRPAQAAGLAALQHFLEAGFAAFAQMGSAAEFLSQIETRERTLIRALFNPSEDRGTLAQFAEVARSS